MLRKKLLSKVRFHWHLYVARGGFNLPSTKVGRLERGGIEHWTYFLQAGRQYADLHKKNWHDLSKFLPVGIVLLITGESRHEYTRRNMLRRMGYNRSPSVSGRIVHLMEAKQNAAAHRSRRTAKMGNR